MRLERLPLDLAIRSSSHAVFGFPAADGGDGAAAPLAVLSLRESGSMLFRHGAANKARDAFFASLGVARERVAALELIHSRDVLWPERISELDGKSADGIVVRDRSFVPSVTVADCMPIWLFHGKSGAFGVLHSGWKGTGILARAVDDFRTRLGAAARELSVILGPAIGPCCYAVDEGRARSFASEYGSASGYRAQDGTWRVDLVEANLEIARREGVGALLVVDACTSCDKRLGSNRREGARGTKDANGATGGPPAFTRMLACAGYFPALEAS
ncbi:MAG: polyphenol oxidase family protein [Spirochaetales bacterium]|nr:polyphenol oxidase family protein [Spirochaetales bacterium]